jgi:hypothetical protein
MITDLWCVLRSPVYRYGTDRVLLNPVWKMSNEAKHEELFWNCDGCTRKRLRVMACDFPPILHNRQSGARVLPKQAPRRPNRVRTFIRGQDAPGCTRMYPGCTRIPPDTPGYRRIHQGTTGCMLDASWRLRYTIAIGATSCRAVRSCGRSVVAFRVMPLSLEELLAKEVFGG